MSSLSPEMGAHITPGSAAGPEPEMTATNCAICGRPTAAEELYPSTLSADAFTAQVFSARRLPDRVHYRMARCRTCGLVRSDPVLDAETLAALYRDSAFDYGDELPGLRQTYARALNRLASLVPYRSGLLDVGAGNGFVLQVAEANGWREVSGVEPSEHARSEAPAAIRDRIVNDIMRPGLFAPESLSAVTLFQVLDHLPEPCAVLDECRTLLKPGGAVLAFNHNVAAWSARLLGDRSPIIDVEHTYLYSPRTMRALFEKSGFEVVRVRPVANTYSLRYLTRLLPLPAPIKQSVLQSLERSAIGRTSWTVPLGNLCLIAKRPA